MCRANRSHKLIVLFIVPFMLLRFKLSCDESIESVEPYHALILSGAFLLSTSLAQCPSDNMS